MIGGRRRVIGGDGGEQGQIKLGDLGLGRLFTSRTLEATTVPPPVEGSPPAAPAPPWWRVQPRAQPAPPSWRRLSAAARSGPRVAALLAASCRVEGSGGPEAPSARQATAPPHDTRERVPGTVRQPPRERRAVRGREAHGAGRRKRALAVRGEGYGVRGIWRNRAARGLGEAGGGDALSMGVVGCCGCGVGWGRWWGRPTTWLLRRERGGGGVEAGEGQ